MACVDCAVAKRWYAMKVCKNPDVDQSLLRKMIPCVVVLQVLESASIQPAAEGAKDLVCAVKLERSIVTNEPTTFWIQCCCEV